MESMFRNILPGQLQSHVMQSSRSIFEKFSDTFDPEGSAIGLDIEPKDNIHLLNLKVLREGSHSLFPSLNELCWLDLSYCESLTSLNYCESLETLPSSIFKLKLTKLDLHGCFT